MKNRLSAIHLTLNKKGLRPEGRKPLILKWAIEDLNLRRPPCEDGALPLS